jgi:hypothetical protein
MRRIIGAIAVVTIALPFTARAQDRPFVFSSAISRDAAPQVRVDYELGVGDQALHQQTTTFHPAVSPLSSDAIRDLPATTGRSGYAVGTTFACRF